MIKKKENVVIIAAGGKGKRLKTSGGKQYLPILGRPAIFYTLNAFQKNKKIHRIIVATGPENFKLLKAIVKKYRLTKVQQIVKAGKERFDTVKNALAAVLENSGIVLVHDGSRLLVSQRMINEVLAAAEKYGAAIPAVRPADTIKEIDAAGKVKRTLARNDLRLIQTPQAFKISLLQAAYRKISPEAALTDDAAFLEKLGHSVKIVPGEQINVKLTYPEDISLIEFLIRKYENWFRL